MNTQTFIHDIPRELATALTRARLLARKGAAKPKLTATPLHWRRIMPIFREEQTHRKSSSCLKPSSPAIAAATAFGL
jgi:hypothetical protein